jgi:hypothetical protein
MNIHKCTMNVDHVELIVSDHDSSDTNREINLISTYDYQLLFIFSYFHEYYICFYYHE